MTQDDFDDRPLEIPEPPSADGRRSGASGRMMAAGVVGALTLGGGLGLWARPAPPPQPLAAARAIAPEDAPRPALQIIVEDVPAPIGPLLEVLPGDAAPQLAAPRRPSAGLMKVDTAVAAEPLLVPAVKVEPKLEPKVETVRPPKPPKAEKARTVRAKPEAKPTATAPKVADAKAAKTKAVRLAKIEKAKAEKVKAEKLKAEKLRAEAVRAEKRAAAQKTEKAKAARLAKAKKAEKATKLAKAEAAKKKEVHKAKTKPKPQLAKAKPTKAPVVEKASIRAKPAAKAPPPRKPVVRGEGPMRVARNDSCRSADPGEAAVCADRSLTARDRQMQRAYRNAEAAGVPASALRRQQDRWLQARAAAAREAPWAVEDVYVARISELNDLTRDAREN